MANDTQTIDSKQKSGMALLAGFYLSVAAGQPILHDLYQNPRLPEVASIFLRGVVAGHRVATVQP